MNVESVEIAISSNEIHRVSAKMREAVDEIKELTSEGKKVLVHLDSSFANDHFSWAMRYSKDKNVKEQIRLVNGLLLISLLRSSKIPTHVATLTDRKRALAYLRRTKYAAACVF